MDRAKGLFEMVQAVELLEQQGHDVVLDLVGWPAKGDTILEELRIDAQNRGISDRIVYHGYKAVGPELFAYYKQADIYVIASQSSEGFPRTIWEAMAHSLPVIATSVGGIPHVLSHEKTALLIEPRSSIQLADACLKLIEHPSLRMALIRNGMTLAHENTLENRTKDMVGTLGEMVETVSKRGSREIDSGIMRIIALL